MYELMAIAVGISVGAGWALTSSRMSRAMLALVGVAGAVAVFALSGEAAESPLFLLWDLSQVVVAAVCTAYLVRRLAAPSGGLFRRH